MVTAPESASHVAPSGQAKAAWGRGKVALVTGGVLALMALLTQQIWVRGHVPDNAGRVGTDAIEVTGASSQPVTIALLLLAAAGFVVLLTLGPRWRRVAMVTVLGCLLGIAASAAYVSQHLERSVQVQAATLRNLTPRSIDVHDSQSTLWLWATIAAGLLASVVVWWAVSKRGTTSGPRDAATPAARTKETRDDLREHPIHMWDELSTGADPTLSPGDSRP